MNFLAPGFLVGAGLIAAGIVAIHFIVTREPRMVPLPTARFAPARPVRARSRAMRPQDLLLLLLRVLLVLAVGAALAKPVLQPSPRPAARIVVVDRSRAVADPRETADSARALLGDGDALVFLDSVATVVRTGATDSLGTLVATPGAGRLSSALVVALRTASAMRETADSLELVVVSPLLEEQLDAATDSVRALWPGAIRLIRVAAARDTLPASAIAFDGAADDPLRLALAGDERGAVERTRLVRGALDAADSAWVAAGDRVLVHWPVPPATAGGDTVGAVSAGDAVVVAPFVRHAALGATDVGGTRVAARWVDGIPAAIERAHGSGCIRTVDIDVPTRGDLVLHARFARLVAQLVAPCGGGAASTPASDARVAALAGADASRLVASGDIAPPASVPLPLVPWLLAAALLLTMAALVLQHRIGGAADTQGATA